MNHELDSSKTRWGSSLFRFDAQRRLQRAFSRCLVAGLPSLAERLRREPVLVAMNHVSFWDGFLLPCLERALQADAYCLMERANLERLPFLRFTGALPLDCADVRRARTDLEQAARLLDRPGRLLFVFPTGKQVPARFPLRFRSGVARVAELAGVPIVPAALGYDFLEDPKPEIRISIGAPVVPGPGWGATRRHLEAAVREELERIDASVLGRSSTHDPAFVPLLPDRPRGLPGGSKLLAWLSPGRSA
jgi:1-acyl-sn-glycerol-3-phosphate acyltransferase